MLPPEKRKHFNLDREKVAAMHNNCVGYANSNGARFPCKRNINLWDDLTEEEKDVRVQDANLYCSIFDNVPEKLPIAMCSHCEERDDHNHHAMKEAIEHLSKKNKTEKQKTDNQYRIEGWES